MSTCYLSILPLQVHEDLLHIKEQLVNSGQTDISIIQNAIEKTESNIKVNFAELFLFDAVKF